MMCHCLHKMKRHRWSEVCCRDLPPLCHICFLLEDVGGYTCRKCKLSVLQEEKVQQFEACLSTVLLIREDDMFWKRAKKDSPGRATELGSLQRGRILKTGDKHVEECVIQKQDYQKACTVLRTM